MATPVPALSQPYHTRANMQVPDTSTATILSKWSQWALKAALMNQLTAFGTVDGTRHANSVWTCIGSSDGVTAGLDGVDRWGSTFDISKINPAASGTSHSWIALRNVTNGYDIVIDLNQVTTGNAGLRALRTSGTLTGGSTTVCPTSSGNTEEFIAGATSLLTTTTSGYVTWGDSAGVGLVNHAHFVTNDDGSCWWWAMSFVGSGRANVFTAFWKGVGGGALDSRNQWFIKAGSSTTGDGAPTATILAVNAALTRRGYNNVGVASRGIRWTTYGGTTIENQGVDRESGNFIVVPMDLMVSEALPVICGAFPDLYLTTASGRAGSCYPSAAAMDMVVLGNCLVPCGIPLTL